MKTNAEIKAMLRAIAEDGCGIVADDSGSGSAGPRYIDADTIRGCLADGAFDGAREVKLDEMHMRESFDLCAVDWREDDWYQVEFGRRENGYHQIAWIWSV